MAGKGRASIIFSLDRCCHLMPSPPLSHIMPSFVSVRGFPFGYWAEAKQTKTRKTDRAP